MKFIFNYMINLDFRILKNLRFRETSLQNSNKNKPFLELHRLFSAIFVR